MVTTLGTPALILMASLALASLGRCEIKNYKPGEPKLIPTLISATPDDPKREEPIELGAGKVPDSDSDMGSIVKTTDKFDDSIIVVPESESEPLYVISQTKLVEIIKQLLEEDRAKARHKKTPVKRQRFKTKRKRNSSSRARQYPTGLSEDSLQEVRESRRKRRPSPTSPPLQSAPQVNAVKIKAQTTPNENI